MPSLSIIVLFLASCILICHGRGIDSPDQFMPLILATNAGKDMNTKHSPSGQNQLTKVVEQIMKYILLIKSSDGFVDKIVNRQKDLTEKLKVLTFLHKCFEITHKMIQNEIQQATGSLRMNHSFDLSASFNLEELRRAQTKVSELLTSTENRLVALQTWIPPTMPFLGFF